MKIKIRQIPSEGLLIEEKIYQPDLGLEADEIKFVQPLWLEATVTLITNVVVADLTVSGKLNAACGRCLESFEFDLKKSFQLEYVVEKSDIEIDLAPDIRQEIILDFPLQPLCQEGCKGLCVNCGKNLNVEKCNCHKS